MKIENFKRYTFNKEGTILSNRGKVLSYHKCKKGYCRVNLKNDKGRKQCYLLHRMIAKAFIENPENKPQVNHIDGNKENNHVDNLEWSTPQENVTHSVSTGLVKRGKDKPNSKVTDEDVRLMRKLRETERTNYYKLGKMFNIAYQTAHKICSKQTYTHVI